jgi:hypothetical protein
MSFASFVLAEEEPVVEEETADTEAPTPVPWGGCQFDDEGLVTIGKKTTICLTISDGANWTDARTYMRLNFQPIADDYSRFAVPNCTLYSSSRMADSVVIVI